jgi:hypothetical protein
MVTRPPRLSLSLVSHCQRCGGTASRHEPGCDRQAEINRAGIEQARAELRRSLRAGGRAGPPDEATEG